MYIFFGLPVEEEVDIKKFFDFFNSKYLNHISIFTLPDFCTQILDDIFSSADNLEQLDQNMSNVLVEYNRSLKRFFSTQEFISIKQEYDETIKSIMWKTEKYNSKSLSEVIEILEAEYTAIKAALAERNSTFDQRTKDVERAKRETEGGYKEMDVIEEDHDFLSEHFIVVDNSKVEEYLMKLENIEEVPDDSSEVVNKNKEETVFRIIAPKMFHNTIKKKIQDSGLHYKQGISAESFNKRINEREQAHIELNAAIQNTKNFLETRYKETVDLYAHIKFMKLYTECALAYGPGKNCFFKCGGKNHEKIINFLQKKSTEWSYSNRFTFDKELENPLVSTSLEDFNDEE